MFKVGDLFFVDNPNSIFGEAITYGNYREFGVSDCTHIGIISKVWKNKVLIHEALNKGFVAREYSNKQILDGIKSGKYKIGRLKEKPKNVFYNCSKYNNLSYGWLDIFGIALSSLFGWRVLGLTGKNKLICSEAVSRIVYDSTKRTDFAKEYDIVFDAVTPQHIYLSKFVRILKWPGII